MSKPTTELTIEQQQRLIESLRAHPSFREPCAVEALIETHISWVLLCGDYAFKIKKAVNLGFLDFSTLARRRQYCFEELRLNRRLAPALYLDVIAIGGTVERPLTEVTDNPIEYAVKMARFRQSELLDRMLREQRLRPGHIDRIAERLAEFHQRQPCTPPQAELGTPEAVHEPTRANFTALRAHVTDPHRLQQIDALERWNEAQFEALRPHFVRRRRDGFVRECHGDLHLGNMAVHDGEVLAFDGIEFNPALYWIDVISEAAFLFMDLDDHGRGDLAWRFLNRYLSHTGDCDGMRILRYYLCYRAMVRAKVAAIRASQAGGSETVGEYLDLATRYSEPQAPVLALTHGVSGTGKSTVCGPLAERVGAVHLRSDRERQRAFGRRGEQPPGHGSYSEAASDRTYERLYHCAEPALAAGFSVIVDATFLAPARRQSFAGLAARCGAALRILHFAADPASLRQRIRQRQETGADISEAGLRVLQHQLERYQPLAASEQAVALRLDTDREDVDALVARAAAALRISTGQT